ncbi:amino acid adenylation domain-containing protein, partial [Paenibacillus lentus]|uniref:amino acid adenylation domain-containing protein n=1 Tax=Paenibacillus lentus TaxID=1338368 RepID=UPI003666EB06
MKYPKFSDRKDFILMAAINTKIKQVFPLTPMQEGMLFSSIYDEDSEAYLQQKVITIEGDLNIALLQQSFQLLVDRHDILRTNFVYEKIQSPMQVVFHERQAHIHFEDISNLPQAEQEHYVARFIENDRAQGFNLVKGELIRMSVLQCAGDSSKIVFTFHHILMDGWCVGIITRELFELYHALGQGGQAELPATFPYRKYIDWIGKQDKAEAAAYWSQYLEGYEDHVSLPRKKGSRLPRMIETTHEFSLQETRILNDLARRNQVTVNTVFQTLWGILLQKYNESRDVVFGSVVSGRPAQLPGIDQAVGLFINTLPVRILLDEPDLSFNALVRRQQTEAILSRSFEYFPLYEVQALTEMRQDLIDHIIVFENFPLREELETLSLGLDLGFKATSIEEHDQTNYDLTLIVYPGDTLTLQFSYNAEVYDPFIIEAIPHHLGEMIRFLEHSADAPVAQIEYMTEKEKKRCLELHESNNADFPRDRTIHHLFEEQVAKYPDQIAVKYGEHEISYQELNRQANQLARYLQQQGVGPDTIVGIFMNRSVELVIGILGILKAGGAYLPIDPIYPHERIEFMLKDSRTSLLLSERELCDRLDFSGQVVCFDDQPWSLEDGSNVEGRSDSGDLAYIIYTSGTTGLPKGVMIEHRNVVRLLIHNQPIFDFDASDTWTMFHSPCFDFSVWEMYGALLFGGKLIIVSKVTAQSPMDYLQLLKDEKVTVLNQTPTAFYALMNEEAAHDSCELTLKYVIFGGEALQPSMLADWKRKYPFTKLINMYGITETTVHVTFKEITGEDIQTGISNIGVPIPTLSCYVFNQQQELCPIGMAGELYVGGEGVARGYLHRDELTRQRFLVNPYKPNERLYRTGDLVRTLPSGEMEYLGRTDHQVKIRGFRIELGEIEANLLEHPAVKEAVVIVREDRPGEKYICAYIVQDEGREVWEYRGHLSANLPDYMIPSVFVFLDEIPITSNGKMDRKRLPAPSLDERSEEFTAPDSPMEERLFDFWKEILNRSDFGVTDNFFEYGGHSLKATMLISRIQKEWDVQVPLKQVFVSPTIRELSRFITGMANEKSVEIMVAEPREYYPLSFAQQRLYLLDQIEGSQLSYNLFEVLKLKGRVDLSLLTTVMSQLIERHESLRTSFHQIDGVPVQKVHSNVHFALEEWTISSESEVESAVRQFVRPFDLSQAPLFRVGVAPLSEDECILMIDLHHIVADGVSTNLLISDFMDIYMQKTLPESRIQYKDFAVWQNDQFAGGFMDRQKSYWIERFAGEIPVLNLPRDYSRPDRKSYAGRSIDFTIDSEIVVKLQQLAAANQASLYMVMLAAYQIMMSKYSGQEDIVVGTPSAGRTQLSIEQTVGMFVNTLAIRGFPSGRKKFTDFLHEIKETTLLAFQNQDYPYEALVDQLALPRDLSRNPLFDVFFAMQNFGKSSLQSDGILVETVNLPHSTSKFDLTFGVMEEDDQLACYAEYSTDLFAEESILCMIDHYKNILSFIARRPNAALYEINMLSDAEFNRLVHQWNDTALEYDNTNLVHLQFECQAKQNPDRIAVFYHDKALTFAELNERADRLAMKLRSIGVRPNQTVGLLTDRGLEMVVGIMAILKAGGAFLPISPEFPAERIKFMIEDSATKVMLSQNRYMNKVSMECCWIDLEDTASHFSDISCEPVINTPADMAYVIYTSGSTGTPKGVVIEHGSLVNRLQWMQSKYPIGEQDVILQKTPYTFDVSVWELLWWATTGSAVCMLEKGAEKDPAEIVRAVKAYEVTTMHFVPSMLNIFLEYLDMTGSTDDLRTLRQVFASGEALQPDHVRRFHAMLTNPQGTALINLYGPTEATIDVSYYDCLPGLMPEGIVPIGKPIQNTRLYIVDQYMNLLPAGVPGELVIAGDGVARGYMNKPELTEEKFVNNPLEPGQRIYRTGDLCKWMPDGNIEYLGRIDFQVKIRGNRIDPGEIEHALLAYDGIRAAEVIARKYGNDDQQLCAYYSGEKEISSESLSEHLSNFLPDYMIPGFYVFLEEMPLTENGKLNRKALPEPQQLQLAQVKYEAPANRIEERLAQLWESVLGVQNIGVTTNFFDIGGHSLKAALLVSTIHKELNVNVPLREIFTLSTIREQAGYIARHHEAEYTSIRRYSKQDYYQVSSAQKRMYILNQLEPAQTTYNLPAVLAVQGELDEGRLEEAFRRLIQRHEILRTSFEMREGEPVQLIHEEVPFHMERAVISDGELESQVEQFVRPFNLASAPLLRAEFIRVKDSETFILFDIHHIISDGITLNIISEELMTFYSGRELPERQIHYKDFSYWQLDEARQKELERQRNYWLERYSDRLPLLNIPTDYPRPPYLDPSGNQITIHTNAGLPDQLNRLAKQVNGTLYMVLLSVFKTLLHKYTGDEDLIVGSPVAGRNHADLADMPGMFVNTLALRSQPQRDKTYLEYLEEIKQTTLDALENQDIAFEDLVEQLDVARDLGRNPIFDVMFILQNTGERTLEQEGIKLVPRSWSGNTSKFDLTMEVIEEADGLRITLEYATALFKEARAQRLLQHYIHILEQVAARPEMRLSEIEVATPAERQQLAFDFNATEKEYSRNLCLHEPFERQAEQHPNRVALCMDGQEMTYGELNRRANQLAHL